MPETTNEGSGEQSELILDCDMATCEQTYCHRPATDKPSLWHW